MNSVTPVSQIVAQDFAAHTCCYMPLNGHRKNVKNFNVKSVSTGPPPPPTAVTASGWANICYEVT